MRYLLIDFGASYIKCATFDLTTVVPTITITSPFTNKTTISKKELQAIMQNIVTQHTDVDGIVVCSILGGEWINDTYTSWKNATGKGSNCLVGRLVQSTITHTDHQRFTTNTQYVDKLEIIGSISSIPLYTPLGDTNCVARSITLKENEAVVNIGTGSQIITQNNIAGFYPAGRSFLVYNNVMPVFQVMSKLSLDQIINSSLDVNLAVFEQARTWLDGGSITGITEHNFTIDNIAASMLRSLVNQYRDGLTSINKVTLTGGIPKKLPILIKVFQHYYPLIHFEQVNDNIESTHKGLSNIIKTDLL